MEASSAADDRGVILALRFTATSPDDPRPEEIASVPEDVEGLYRGAPVESALGIPVAELLSQYHAARAETAAEWPPWPFYPRDWRRLGPRELDELFYLASRVWRQGSTRRYASPVLPAPENAIRIRRLNLGSPLDLLAHIPPEYWKGGGFILFLAAVERRFNMVERIRTERVELRARRAERRADEREAELREERAARQLEGLRQEDPPFQLIAGEVLPDDDDPHPPSEA